MKCKEYHVRLKLTRVINLSACILECLLIKDRIGNAIRYSGAMLIFYISIWYGMVFVCYGMPFLCYAMRY